jgi:uncharacterized membrane protein YfcA
MNSAPFLSDVWLNIAQSVCVAIVAFLYSSVGHGGASGYIAVLSLFGLPHEAIASSTLVVNCCVAGLAFFAYQRSGNYKHNIVLPYLILSVPCAFLGAMIPVDKQLFNTLICIILPLTGIRFLLWPNLKGQNEDEVKGAPLPLAAIIGGALGLLSGMVGIGGGVFLSPIMILCKFATTKQTAAASALFILVNSLAGIAGRVVNHKLNIDNTLWPFLAAALCGAFFGSYLGSRRFSSTFLKRLLGFVLVLVALKLLTK